MTIPLNFSKDALKRVDQLFDQDCTSSSLRVYVEGKGCDGFTYGVAFDQKNPDDLTWDLTANVKLLVDPRSLEFIKNSNIIWVDDERGAGFLVENPNQRSFRGKFYKKQKWQDKLEKFTT